MVDKLSPLEEAKELLRATRFGEAISVYESLLSNDGKGAPAAAYNLGIIYQIGKSGKIDTERAKAYYEISRSKGFPMATYQLAGIFFREGNVLRAYELYKEVSSDNPSAAFWAYRIVKNNKYIDDDPQAEESMLLQASRLGHIPAQRIQALRLIFGHDGCGKIPEGVRMFIRAMRKLDKAIDEGDKLTYT